MQLLKEAIKCLSVEDFKSRLVIHFVWDGLEWELSLEWGIVRDDFLMPLAGLFLYSSMTFMSTLVTDHKEHFSKITICPGFPQHVPFLDPPIFLWVVF